MPNIFLLSHPVGTVIGNASFSDFLLVSQNCTIGAETTVYPTFDQGAALNANVSVIGDCRIGRSVVFGAGASIIDRCVPANTLVLGQIPNNRAIPRDLAVSDRYFKQVIPPSQIGPRLREIDIESLKIRFSNTPEHRTSAPGYPRNRRTTAFGKPNGSCRDFSRILR